MLQTRLIFVLRLVVLWLTLLGHAPRLNASSYTLSHFYSAALLHDPNLSSSLAGVDQAKAQRSQLKALAMPSLDLLYSYQRIDPVTNIFGQNLSPALQQNSRFQLRQPVFQGGAEYAAFHRGETLEEVATLRTFSAKRTLYLEVAKAFFEAILANNLRLNSERALSAIELRVKENHKRYKQGRLSESSYLSSQAQYSLEQSQVYASKARQETAQLELTRLTGSQISDLSLLVIPEIREPPKQDKILDKLARHPEIATLQKQQESEDQFETQTKGSFLPRVDLLGNYYLLRQGPLASSQWDASLQASWSIFNGGLNRAQILESTAKQKDLEIQLQGALTRLKTQADSLQQFLIKQRVVIEQIKVSLKHAENAFNASKKESKKGSSDELEALLLLTNYISTKDKLEQSFYDYQISWSQFDALTGETL